MKLTQDIAENFPEERIRLEKCMGTPAYESWIRDNSVRFRVIGKCLIIICRYGFTFDMIERKFNACLRKVFDVEYFKWDRP